MQEIKNKSENFLFTCDQKLKWFGYGEWVEETDCFLFKYKGYYCAVHRVLKREPCEEEVFYGGHLCGYVEVPKNNPYYKKYFCIDIEDVDVCLDCHGGITYDDKESFISTLFNKPRDHWIGFDCGHSGDLIPSMELFKKSHKTQTSDYMQQIKNLYNNVFASEYRNISFCIKECMSLVDQLEHLKHENLNAKAQLDEIS